MTIKYRKIEEMQDETSITESTLCGFLRFPLMCGIVFIHARFDIPSCSLSETHTFIYSLSSIYNSVSIFISNIICSVCVPLFYFISGFLFFYRSNFNFYLYKEKLKRRFHSLFIPYVFWNALVFCIIFISSLYVPSKISDNFISLNISSILDLLKDFWAVSSNYNSTPIAIQFWFIRNLMITVLFTPVIYYAIKKLKILFLILLSILWFFDLWPNIPGFGSNSFLFFSIGSYFSIKDESFISIFTKNHTLFFSLYIICIVITFILWGDALDIELLKISILFGIPTIIGFWSKRRLFIEKIINFKVLSNSSFFLFAYHFLPLIFIEKILLRILPVNGLSYLFIYFVSPIIIIVMGVLLYVLLYRSLPKFTAVITGGR